MIVVVHRTEHVSDLWIRDLPQTLGPSLRGQAEQEFVLNLIKECGLVEMEVCGVRTVRIL